MLLAAAAPRACATARSASRAHAGAQPWYGKTIIRSCAKLDYGTAQRIIDGGDEFTEEEWAAVRRPPADMLKGLAGDIRLLAEVRGAPACVLLRVCVCA